MAVITPAADAASAPNTPEAPVVESTDVAKGKGKGKGKKAEADAKPAAAVAEAVASTEIVEPVRESITDGRVQAMDLWENVGNGDTPIHGDCIIFAPERIRIPHGKAVRLLRGYREAIQNQAPNHLRFAGEV